VPKSRAQQTPTAATPGGPQDAPTTAEAENPSTPTAPPAQIEGEEYPTRLVRVEDQDRHWNVAKGLWEQVTHAETGEPNYFYSLVATIDGVDVELMQWNAGRVDTRVNSLRQANQSTSASRS
jgi:hypothetical protein